MIKKTDIFGEVISKYPEVAPVLMAAGLHCIGCHVSAYETIEQGCAAHGMKEKDITELVKKANERVAVYDKLAKVSFTRTAVSELDKRLGKPKKKFVKVVAGFGGEFDFEAAGKKEKDDFVIEAVAKVKKKSDEVKVNVLAEKRIERMLRGVVIDYDHKKKDFTAKRV